MPQFDMPDFIDFPLEAYSLCGVMGELDGGNVGG